MIVNTLLITTTQLEPFYYAGLLFLQPWAPIVAPLDPRRLSMGCLPDVLPLYMLWIYNEYICDIELIYM